MALFIKKIIAESFGKSAGAAVKVIYGGSVDINNSREYLLNENISGILVGGASLDIKEFLAMVKNI